MAEPSAPAEQQVEVLDKVGRKGTIPVSQLEAAKAQGYIEAPASEKGVYEKAVEKGFGPIAATGIAAVSPLLSYEQGSVEGATAGLGSGLQRKIAGVIGPIAAWAAGGPDMTAKEAEDFYRDIAQGKAHPFIHGTGVVAGIAGSTLAGSSLRTAGGVAGGVGRALGGITEAGEAAARGATALTGSLASKGLAGQVLSQSSKFAAQAAIENGLFTGISELSEEMFGDPKLSAGKILAATAEGAHGGALFGGILGGTYGAARGIKGIAANALTRNAGELATAANEQRWRALNPTVKFTREAEARVPGGAKAIGDTLGEYNVLGGTFKEVAENGGIEGISQKLDEAVQSVGQKLGDLYAGSSATIPLGKIDDAIAEVISPLTKKGGHERLVQSLNEYRQSVVSKLMPEELSGRLNEIATSPEAIADFQKAVREHPVSIQDAIFQRKALDDLVFREAKALDPGLRVGFLRDARKNFEGVIVDAFDDAAKLAGQEGARAELLKLKGDYQKLSIAKEAAENAGNRELSNRSISLTDYISGGIASGIGATVGGAVGGETGAAIGGFAGGAMGARLNKLFRQHGNAALAVALDRLAAAGGKASRVSPATAERIIQQVEKEVAPVAAKAEEAAAPTIAKEAEAGPATGRPSEAAEVPTAAPRVTEESKLIPPEIEPLPPFEAPPVPKMAEVGPAPSMADLGERPKPFEREMPAAREIGPEPPAFTKPKPEPPKGEPDTRPFDDRLNDVLHELDRKPNGKSRYDGLVPMYEVRKKFPDLSREEFDKEILRIRNDSTDFKTNVADQIKHLSDEAKAGLVERKYNRGPEGDISREGKQHIAYISTFREPSEMAFKGETSAAAGSDAKAAYERDLAAWESEKSASEQARAAWKADQKAALKEHDVALGRWNDEMVASDEAETAFAGREKQARAEYESALAKWSEGKSAAETRHVLDMAEYQSAIDARKAAEAAHAAMVLEKTAEFAEAQRAARLIDQQIEAAAKGLIDGPREVVPSAPKEPVASVYRDAGRSPAAETEVKDISRRYKKAIKALETAQEQQSVIVDKMSANWRHMPQIAMAATMSAMRAINFLSTVAPKPMVGSTMFPPNPDRISTVQMTRYLEADEVARTHGGSALRQFKKGRLAVNAARAFEVVEPELFAQLQQQCIKLVAERQAAGTPIDFAARQRMHILLKAPTDRSQGQRMMSNLQDNWVRAAEESQAKQAAGGGGGRPVTLPSEVTKQDTE